ncbi:sigma-54-dependent transcriptional regulator [Arcobacter sp.]|uniref:sigma-54-dependent transcriptional regulator n=1 Tax=Arcobacter sp. TaxID=1872629 RepID=UPI003D11418A
MNIAIIDDHDDIKYAIEKILKKENHTCYGFIGSEEELIEGLNVFEIDLIILDMMLENNLTGLDVIKRIRDFDIEIPVIMITAYTTPSNLIEASKAGIIDIIQKPFGAADIIQTVNKYTPNHIKNAFTNIVDDEEFIGSFKTMKDVYKKIGIASKNNSNILIKGETGTGKDLVAKLIHKNSKNCNEPFVAINCPTIPENLFEKLMYGKIENFSKNQKDPHIGYIQKVGTGTLFLDEINELHPSLQVKLLRFLETKTFYPLGSSEEQQFKGRIICSTSNTKEEIENSSLFRKDLYYRISTFEIELPNLSNRTEDIKELILYFIKLHCKNLKIKQKSINDDAISFLMQFKFDGNVRELKNIIYKAILNSRNETILIDDIKSNIEDKENYKIDFFDKIIEELLNMYGLENANLIMEDFEKYMIEAVMNKDNNISRASNYLNITRNTLKSKLKKYDIS